MLRVISNSFLCLVLLQSRFSDAQSQVLRGLGGRDRHPSSSKRLEGKKKERKRLARSQQTLHTENKKRGGLGSKIVVLFS